MLAGIPPLILYLAVALVAAVVLWLLIARVVRQLRLRGLEAQFGSRDIAETILSGQIAQGMTPEMVIEAWGEPADMDEKVLKTKTKREMKFDHKGGNRYGTRVWFENDVVVGWETK